MGRNFRKYVVCLLVLVLVSINTISIADDVKDISINIDGIEVLFNNALGYPFLDENNRTLVPFRVTLETFGATVSWDQNTNIAKAEKDLIKVEVPIGQKYIIKNGSRIDTDTVAQIKGGRTYLPIRAVLEAFGSQVSWNELTKTVVVNADNNSNNTVKIKDINLEDAVRNIIGKRDGTLLKGDLLSIKELSVRDSNISSLEGIQYLVNLERLDIFNNLVIDLKPLTLLEKLKFVDFQFNLVRNIDPVINRGLEFSGYGNPANNTFNIEEKLNQIEQAFYLNGKCKEAYEMASTLLELGEEDIHNKLDNWIIEETENFTFYFQKYTKVTNIDEYANRKEEAFEKINGIFKVKLPTKITYFVWNTNEDAIKKIGYSLGFAMPDFRIVHSRYNQSLGHEMTHVIVGNIDGAIKQTGLINEGLATYFNLEDYDKLKAAKTNRSCLKEGKISIKDWWLNWPGEMVGNYHNTYEASASFIGYLIEVEGMEKMVKLAKNQTYENAKIIYGDIIDKYINDFEKIINN